LIDRNQFLSFGGARGGLDASSPGSFGRRAALLAAPRSPGEPLSPPRLRAPLKHRHLSVSPPGRSEVSPHVHSQGLGVQIDFFFSFCSVPPSPRRRAGSHVRL